MSKSIWLYNYFSWRSEMINGISRGGGDHPENDRPFVNDIPDTNSTDGGIMSLNDNPIVDVNAEQFTMNPVGDARADSRETGAGGNAMDGIKSELTFLEDATAS